MRLPSNLSAMTFVAFTEHGRLTRRFFVGLGAGAAAAAAVANVARMLLPNWRRRWVWSRTLRRGRFSRCIGCRCPFAARREENGGCLTAHVEAEVISDPAIRPSGARVTKEAETALDFASLCGWGEACGSLCQGYDRHIAARSACIWEGVPLRDVLWLTKPREDAALTTAITTTTRSRCFAAPCRSAASWKIRSTCRR
jgi:hypothetical protein